MPKLTWFYNIFIVGFGKNPPRTAIEMVFAAMGLLLIVFAITLGPLLVKIIREVNGETRNRMERITGPYRKPRKDFAGGVDLLFFFPATGIPLAIAMVMGFVFVALLISLFYNYVCAQNVSVSYYEAIGLQLRHMFGVVGLILAGLSVWVYETGKKLFLSRDMCEAMIQVLVDMVGKEKGTRVFSLLCRLLDSGVSKKTRRGLLNATKTATQDKEFGMACIRTILLDLVRHGGLRSHGIDGQDRELVEEVMALLV